jgi:3-phenylpropionate/trans-cinnamate dioxygenase ferredoxin reductase subunit
VVGAGWIGAEVAASARQRGLDVTMLGPGAVPLEHVMGREVGAVYRHVHTDHGAARSMLGAPAIYDRIPYFFSDQYDVGMEYVGYARQWDRVVFRGDPASREFMAFWMAHDRVVAGMNVNSWDVSDTVAELILARVAVDDRDLADPDLPLPTLASRPEGKVA